MAYPRYTKTRVKILEKYENGTALVQRKNQFVKYLIEQKNLMRGLIYPHHLNSETELKD